MNEKMLVPSPISQNGRGGKLSDENGIWECFVPKVDS